MRSWQDEPTCAEVEHFLPWFLDDELDLELTSQIERHLRACEACGEALAAEGRLRMVLHRAADSLRAPVRLRRRLNETLAADQNPVQRWSRRLPAVAAAAILLAFAWQGTQAEADDLVEAASRHARNLPMDVMAGGADVGKVQSYLSGKLPFAVQVPQMAEPPRNLGGRVIQLNNQDAAYVRYETPRGVVSVFIYEGSTRARPEVGLPRDLEPVLTRRVRGYSAMRWMSRGLVYSVVSDLSERELPDVLRLNLAGVGPRDPRAPATTPASH